MGKTNREKMDELLQRMEEREKFSPAKMKEREKKSGEALKVLLEQEDILRSTNAQDALGDCLHNQALLLVELGRLDDALLVRLEQGEIHQSIGKKDKVVVALSGEAVIYELKGMFREALAKNEEACDLARNVGLTNMIPVLQVQARELRAKLGLDKNGNKSNPLRPFRMATGIIEMGISFVAASLITHQLLEVVPPLYTYSALAIGMGVIMYIVAAIKQRQWPENEGIKDVFWILFIGGFYGVLLGLILRFMPVIFTFYTYGLLFLFIAYRKS